MNTRPDSETDGPTEGLAVDTAVSAAPQGLQAWIEANRSRIWIWGIAALALGGIACMMLFVIVLIIRR